VEESEKQKNIRQLKIYKKFINQSNKISVVPEIRLSGKWLKEYGFKQGDSISVVCETEEIIIRLKKAGK